MKRLIALFGLVVVLCTAVVGCKVEGEVDEPDNTATIGNVR